MPALAYAWRMARATVDVETTLDLDHYPIPAALGVAVILVAGVITVAGNVRPRGWPLSPSSTRTGRPASAPMELACDGLGRDLSTTTFARALWECDQMTAVVDVLAEGYAGDRVAGTVTLIRDGDTAIVVDPGMVAGRGAILDPLARLGVEVDDVTDVVFSHHHPDHTLNAALFPRARFHDHWAIYQDDRWEDRDADGFVIAPAVSLMATPGHTAQDISTLVQTATGLVVLTHLWWHSGGPQEDPLVEDSALLALNRTKVLALEPTLIIPGHGAPFAPSAT